MIPALPRATGTDSALTVDACILVAAFDGSDRFHREATDFLMEVAQRGVRLIAPRLLLLEVRCAIARRARDADAGARADAALRAAPFLQLVPVDDRLLDAAGGLGAMLRLRSADALYAACAELHEAPLVSLDAELVSRANASLPQRVFNRRS